MIMYRHFSMSALGPGGGGGGTVVTFAILPGHDAGSGYASNDAVAEAQLPIGNPGILDC